MGTTLSHTQSRYWADPSHTAQSVGRRQLRSRIDEERAMIQVNEPGCVVAFRAAQLAELRVAP
jgi:hypothetical protein